MDENRKAVLAELFENSRQSDSNIAKKLRIPRHIVSYHHKELIRKGIIKKNLLQVDFRTLGLQEFIVYLKIFKYSQVKDKVREFIINHPNTRWAAEVFPQYNLRIVFLAKGIDDLQNYIFELEKICEDRIHDKFILYTRNLVKNQMYLKKSDKMAKTQIALTKSDINVLKVLFKNPQSTLKEIAVETGLSIEGSRFKVNNLKKNKVIRTFSVDVDKQKLGLNFWIQLFLKVNKLDEVLPVLEEVLHSESIFGKTRKVFGKYDVEATLFLTAQNELSSVIDKLETSLGSNLEDYGVLFTQEKFLDHRIPDVVLDNIN